MESSGVAGDGLSLRMNGVVGSDNEANAGLACIALERVSGGRLNPDIGMSWSGGVPVAACDSAPESRNDESKRFLLPASKFPLSTEASVRYSREVAVEGSSLCESLDVFTGVSPSLTFGRPGLRFASAK